jgi:TolA-binding protein
MGECYYSRRQFEDAVREFRVVVERFPQGNKVPDALLKAGYSYLALGKVEAGRRTLEELVRSYPHHVVVPLAVARLRQIADEARGGDTAASPSVGAASATEPEKFPAVGRGP